MDGAVPSGSWKRAGTGPAVRRLLDRAALSRAASVSLAPLRADAPLPRLQAVAAWEVQHRAIGEITASARAHELPLAFLKGADLNLRVYPVPGTRPMVDVDVLVEASHLDALRRAIETLGFARHPLPGDPPVDRALAWRFLRREDGVLLDVHTAVDWPEALGISTAALLDRRQFAPDRRVPVLDAADLLLNVATHAVRDVREDTTHMLVDAVLVLDVLELGWDRVLRCATEWRARPALRALLGRLRRFAGYPVPDAVLRELAVGLCPHLSSKWMATFLRPPYVLRAEALERLFRLGLIERPRDRWRLVHRYAALRLAGPCQ